MKPKPTRKPKPTKRLSPFAGRDQGYFPRPLPESLSFWIEGLGKTPLWVWGRVVAEPVVTPGLAFELIVASAPAFPSGSADEVIVVPNSAAIARIEIASLDRMIISSLDIKGL
jgi:hypothetical protein